MRWLHTSQAQRYGSLHQYWIQRDSQPQSNYARHLQGQMRLVRTAQGRIDIVSTVSQYKLIIPMVSSIRTYEHRVKTDS
jgi:hypothetical protein